MTATALQGTDLVGLARRYAAALSVRPRFTEEHRWYHRIALAEDHEAWLLTWLPGQHTDLHDHGSVSGALLVLSGTILEEVAADDGAHYWRPSLRPRLIPAGEFSAFGPRHVHRVGNVVITPAVSLHVYSPALTTMTRYALTRAGLRVLGHEHNGIDW
jgi:predicted metal-dependent enzyme (double-stranded beta helix superfamily)